MMTGRGGGGNGGASLEGGVQTEMGDNERSWAIHGHTNESAVKYNNFKDKGCQFKLIRQYDVLLYYFLIYFFLFFLFLFFIFLFFLISVF